VVTPKETDLTTQSKAPPPLKTQISNQYAAVFVRNNINLGYT